MEALLVIDAQNEFSPGGKRPVDNHENIMNVIIARVQQARNRNLPIAWIRHFNKPTESPAFVPGSWGADYVEGFGPRRSRDNEREFTKNVYGAFTGTSVGEWLKGLNVREILLVGFYTHACVSTTAREALMRDMTVRIDANGTGTCAMNHEILGQLSASEARRSALMHIVAMGAQLTSPADES